MSDAGTGPPPVSAQRSAGGCARPASSSRASVVATRLTSVTPSSASARRTRLRLEALVDHRGGGVDGGAQQDRKAPDVRQGQRAQPALAGIEPERHRRAERAPQQVAVGQLDRPRGGARAGGVDHDRGRVQVVTRCQRSAAAGSPHARAAPRRAASSHRRRPPRARPPDRRRSTGTATAPSEQAGMQRLGEVRGLRAARSRRASPRPPPRSSQGARSGQRRRARARA